MRIPRESGACMCEDLLTYVVGGELCSVHGRLGRRLRRARRLPVPRQAPPFKTLFCWRGMACPALN